MQLFRSAFNFLIDFLRLYVVSDIALAFTFIGAFIFLVYLLRSFSGASN